MLNAITNIDEGQETTTVVKDKDAILKQLILSKRNPIQPFAHCLVWDEFSYIHRQVRNENRNALVYSAYPSVGMSFLNPIKSSLQIELSTCFSSIQHSHKFGVAFAASNSIIGIRIEPNHTTIEETVAESTLSMLLINIINLDKLENKKPAIRRVHLDIHDLIVNLRNVELLNNWLSIIIRRDLSIPVLLAFLIATNPVKELLNKRVQLFATIENKLKGQLKDTRLLENLK